MVKSKPLNVCDITVQPGERVTLALPTPELYSCVKTHIPIHVIHGKQEGPVLLVCAAMHGDEANGIAIIQKVLSMQLLKSLAGTLIAIPVMSSHGLVMRSRTLMDQKDLANAFPGKEEGLFTERLAYLLSKDILSIATHCIDLHSGKPFIQKTPQVRTVLDLPDVQVMARAFQVPIIVDPESRKGLLWMLHEEKPVPTVVFDTGEPMHFDVLGIREGVKGILRVMRDLKMLKEQKSPMKSVGSYLVEKQEWVHSHGSGLLRFYKELGRFVPKGALIAKITEPFGTAKKEEIYAQEDGILLAKSTRPIVYEGEPLFQLAEKYTPLNGV